MEILDLKFGGISVGVLLAVGYAIWGGRRMLAAYREDRAFRKELDAMHKSRLEDGPDELRQ
jgi:hypothetical protein